MQNTSAIRIATRYLMIQNVASLMEGAVTATIISLLVGTVFRVREGFAFQTAVYLKIAAALGFPDG